MNEGYKKPEPTDFLSKSAFEKALEHYEEFQELKKRVEAECFDDKEGMYRLLIQMKLGEIKEYNAMISKRVDEIEEYLTCIAEIKAETKNKKEGANECT